MVFFNLIVFFEYYCIFGISNNIVVGWEFFVYEKFWKWKWYGSYVWCEIYDI